MKLKTELAIKAAIEAQAPAAWSRKNFEALLKRHREAWGAQQSLTTSGLIEFLIDNEIVRPVEIRSKAYDRKMRYVLGRPSPLVKGGVKPDHWGGVKVGQQLQDRVVEYAG
jgi:hypothetical protein